MIGLATPQAWCCLHTDGGCDAAPTAKPRSALVVDEAHNTTTIHYANYYRSAIVLYYAIIQHIILSYDMLYLQENHFSNTTPDSEHNNSLRNILFQGLCGPGTFFDR